MKTKISQPPYVEVQWGGGAGRYSPGTSSTLTKIVLYSSSVYTVFHSVIYNPVSQTLFWKKEHQFLIKQFYKN